MTTASPTFLRLDRPELEGGTMMVVRSVLPADRARRRVSPFAPLAYLFETVNRYEPDRDVRLDAGHYDEANLVWSFTGEVTGIVGITTPMTPESDTPGEQMEVTDVRSSTDEEPVTHVQVDD
ncbi:MAG TPA: hypothetical protein VH969_18365 [Actinophytocola sp.]|jgi:hypothetical protein|uniref:hypothetical protein n=1 Tax=Actinophytocola sp. TaxID=1872138 RepID=UPI002F920703